jgi:hypothetical protein
MRMTRLLIALLCLISGHSARAEIVVVVDARSGIERLTQNEVVNIFLGRYRKLPDGSAAVPVDQPAAGALRAEFYRQLVDKDLSEINAYWSRLYFSGKTTPPLSTASAADVIAQILARPGGIGYIERKDADARVRVVLSFKP